MVLSLSCLWLDREENLILKKMNSVFLIGNNQLVSQDGEPQCILYLYLFNGTVLSYILQHLTLVPEVNSLIINWVCWWW